MKEKTVKLRKKKKFHVDIVAMIFAILALLFVMIPIYIMLETSITSQIEGNESHFHWWPQMGVNWGAYERAFKYSNLLRGFWNTVWMYFPTTIVGVFTSAMAAYAFAKIEFKLKKIMFSILLATLTLPNCMGTISSVMLFNSLGWMDSPLPIMIPRLFGTIGIVFFLRQYYMGMPDDLIGAARVDGLGDVGIFVRILLPLSIPAFIAQFVLNFISGYNQVIEPLLYIGTARYYTLQVEIANFADSIQNNWPLMMAGCVISMTPLTIMYLISQKYILKGVAITTGLKG